MPPVVPHLLYVSATDATAAYPSITAALRHANAGDTVVVGAGRYSPSQTREHFPLYVPPGVSLLGTGQDTCVIDGEGATAPSFRPVLEAQSLILLGDHSTLSDFTITNSGGNGIGNQPGARVQIIRNTIQAHGQHGIIVSGPEEALIKDNLFRDNGTLKYGPETPRPAAARQGHHIFVQGKSGAANRMLICDNTMSRAFADGIAIVVFFDEADGVHMHVRVWRNTIEQSERRGLTIAGSFGPSHNRVEIDVRHNVIRNNHALAVGAQAARPLATQLLRDNRLRMHLVDNECRDNGDGVMLFGGFGPAEQNVLEATVIGNIITGAARYGLRMIGGVGMLGYAAHHNRVQAVVHRNRIEGAGTSAVFLQGGAADSQADVTGNAVLTHIVDNELLATNAASSMLLNDGLPGNNVHVEAPIPLHERVAEPMAYEA
ncbi:right-handed parallel beta-helix repeat-containing protein [Candidatus Entotheonella palauensis]|uniref:DUF1565 domain-containing protein n=1 Tax=Candidatus Entotheonella gemina TaxID=1429439 RepID=W4M276_9BACT|nr:right-handed parallel beta-helix repeat-containing protein [Candidatus Entotheonella palauensis]ETX04280.1 MAG: hypothetical protein ETSY2_29695 [Candidatus Entotheonella gemina]